MYFYMKVLLSFLMDEDVTSPFRFTCCYCGEHGKSYRETLTLLLAILSFLLREQKRHFYVPRYIFAHFIYLKCLFVFIEPKRETNTQSQVRTERACGEHEQTSLYLIFFLYAVHVCYHDDQIPVATHVFYCTEQLMAGGGADGWGGFY